MTAMQHVCAWQACEDERFQVCECGLWRWDPVVSARAADEAHRKTLEGPRAHGEASRRLLGGDVAPSATDGITRAQTGGNQGAA